MAKKEQDKELERIKEEAREYDRNRRNSDAQENGWRGTRTKSEDQ